ncbi:MAG: hypothetical protein O7F76_09700 [Planctomycetota bacterium]|nr:hypothetical protein [Planctomycetota bacterium]
MAKRYRPADLSKLKTYSIGDREHKFAVDASAGLPAKGADFRTWWDSLPSTLGAAALHSVTSAIVEARRGDRPVVFALGAHVVKVGCSPIVCDLMRRGVVTAVCMNGATAIHDVEVAIFGQTSEEVADTIRDGRFGMVEETPNFFVEALAGAEKESGLGSALGRHVVDSSAPHAAQSILGVAREVGVPVTVHVAIGTDTIHMHEAVAESTLAGSSTFDFRLICSVVADLAPASPGGPAGVWCNIGSAVLLPEVFLKAVAVARNLGNNLDEITTANLDMIRHYRPSENVIGRPVRKGRGHQIIGHHEIMLPLLRQAIVETM